MQNKFGCKGTDVLGRRKIVVEWACFQRIKPTGSKVEVAIKLTSPIVDCVNYAVVPNSDSPIFGSALKLLAPLWPRISLKPFQPGHDPRNSQTGQLAKLTFGARRQGDSVLSHAVFRLQPTAILLSPEGCVFQAFGTVIPVCPEYPPIGRRTS